MLSWRGPIPKTVTALLVSPVSRWMEAHVMEPAPLYSLHCVPNPTLVYKSLLLSLVGPDEYGCMKQAPGSAARRTAPPYSSVWQVCPSGRAATNRQREKGGKRSRKRLRTTQRPPTRRAATAVAADAELCLRAPRCDLFLASG